uniref:AlNc14C71G4889 protein n=1 Tax=Albugo laibachii Nc14 TaxID=890382 RepID=F0WE28_9STRA|nr:AlNc14C71G4889 [Albugo laibachii Nc14]|eukprot:CCA19457.1 AlNc14C71G4889 [Albugo laibachii Nc14]
MTDVNQIGISGSQMQAQNRRMKLHYVMATFIVDGTKVKIARDIHELSLACMYWLGTHVKGTVQRSSTEVVPQQYALLLLKFTKLGNACENICHLHVLPSIKSVTAITTHSLIRQQSEIKSLFIFGSRPEITPKKVASFNLNDVQLDIEKNPPLGTTDLEILSTDPGDVILTVVEYGTVKFLVCLTLMYEILVVSTLKSYVWMIEPKEEERKCKCNWNLGPHTKKLRSHSLQPVFADQIKKHLTGTDEPVLSVHEMSVLLDVDDPVDVKKESKRSD